MPSYDGYLESQLAKQEKQEQEDLGRRIEDGEICPDCLQEPDPVDDRCSCSCSTGNHYRGFCNCDDEEEVSDVEG